VRRLVERDEELRPIRPRTLVGHAHHAALRVPQRRADLVVEPFVPDGPAALGIVGRRVRRPACLDDEFRNESVERRRRVVA
jgi:hypothetical protein